jgi:ABC-type sugar transport system substrate-binding protein
MLAQSGVSRTGRVVRWTAVGVVGALVASGCSSSSSKASGGSRSGSATDSACLTATQKFLVPWSTPPTSLPAGFTPLSEKPAPGGTIIKVIRAAVPAEQEGAQAQAEAAKSIGWTAKTISYNGSVEDLNAKFMQAIAEKPTIITSASTDPASIAQPLAAAKKAGIVVQISSSPTTGPSGYPGYAAGSGGPQLLAQIGDIMANWVMNDSGCKANVAVATLAGLPTQEGMAKKVRADLSATCSSCKSSYVPLQPADVGSPKVTNAIVSALQAHPSINYLVVTLGNITDGLAASLQQAGLDHVKIVGATPDNASIKALQDGTNAMWVDLSVVMNGWVELDAGLRALDQQHAVWGHDFPLAVLTPSNIAKGSSDIPTYPTDYATLFKQIWKAG